MMIMMTTKMMIPGAVRCLAGVLFVFIPLQVEVYHSLVHFFLPDMKKNVFHFFVKIGVFMLQIDY